jgi:hypothetical protein
MLEETTFRVSLTQLKIEAQKDGPQRSFYQLCEGRGRAAEIKFANV